MGLGTEASNDTKTGTGSDGRRVAKGEISPHSRVMQVDRGVEQYEQLASKVGSGN